MFYHIHHYRLVVETLKLTDYLKQDSIEIGVAADSKEDLLDAVLKLADKNPHVLDAKKVRAAVLEREKDHVHRRGQELRHSAWQNRRRR